MEMQGRVKGYVLGKDNADGTPTWKVRVTDESSPFLDDKLFVASVRENVMLAQGCEVTFLIGAFAGRNKETYHKAVDVALPAVSPKCDFCTSKAEILMEISEYEDRGAAEAIRCCLPHIMRAIRQGQESPIIKAKTKLFQVINIAAGDKEWRKLEGVF